MLCAQSTADSAAASCGASAGSVASEPTALAAARKRQSITGQEFICFRVSVVVATVEILQPGVLERVLTSKRSQFITIVGKFPTHLLTALTLPPQILLAKSF
jgi:hypothetical protein